MLDVFGRKTSKTLIDSGESILYRDYPKTEFEARDGMMSLPGGSSEGDCCTPRTWETRMLVDAEQTWPDIQSRVRCPKFGLMVSLRWVVFRWYRKDPVADFIAYLQLHTID